MTGMSMSRAWRTMTAGRQGNVQLLIFLGRLFKPGEEINHAAPAAA